MARRIQGMYRVWKARKFRRATLWRADLLVERKKSAARRAIQVWLDRLLRARKARKAFQRNLLLCMTKVWDVREGQFFWLNQFTKIPTWTKVSHIIHPPMQIYTHQYTLLPTYQHTLLTYMSSHLSNSFLAHPLNLPSWI